MIVRWVKQAVITHDSIILFEVKPQVQFKWKDFMHNNCRSNGEVKVGLQYWNKFVADNKLVKGQDYREISTQEVTSEIAKVGAPLKDEKALEMARVKPKAQYFTNQKTNKTWIEKISGKIRSLISR